MVEEILSLEEKCATLKRMLREFEEEANYYKKIAEETGKRRLRDIHELSRLIAVQKTAEEERTKLETKLRDAKKMEAIATLAGGIAHEFNNALFTLFGSIELMQMDLPNHDIVKKYTETMKKSTHRMANLTDKLLAYAQGGKYQAKIISLSDYVEETLPFLTPMMGQSLRIETDLPRNVPKIMADLTQMQLVLSAVLTNASEAIEGEGRIRISVKEENVDEHYVKENPDARAGHFVCLTVEDDGKGMDIETQQRIFEPFFTTKFQGRGLGMAAVYGIIRNHEGWITVDSGLEKGATVHIYIPVVKHQSRKYGTSRLEELAGRGTILVIEDDEYVMDTARQMLQKLGCLVLEAATGREAINVIESSDGDISAVLLDIGLPDMEGSNVFSIITKVHPEIKVIVCSGYSIDGPVQKILDSGAHGFLQKPFSFTTLSEKMKEVLADK
jgi:two-component system, cell cycle sensor histidine kinase and response regulator CckA